MLARILKCDPYALEVLVLGLAVGTYLAVAF
jgi:hypothetical protein